MRRPGYSSLHVPAAAVAVLLGALFVLIVVNVAATVLEMNAADRLRNGLYVSDRDRDAIDSFSDGAAFLYLVNFVAFGVAFIWWLRRATCNLSSFGADGRAYGPGWAIGGWFVPILALWRPLQVMSQAWRGSARGPLESEWTGWQREPTPWFIVAWWLLFVSSWLVGRVAMVLYGAAETYDDVLLAGGWFLASLAFDAVAGAFAVVAVVGITFRHQAADDWLDPRADTGGAGDVSSLRAGA